MHFFSRFRKDSKVPVEHLNFPPFGIGLIVDVSRECVSLEAAMIQRSDHAVLKSSDLQCGFPTYFPLQLGNGLVCPVT